MMIVYIFVKVIIITELNWWVKVMHLCNAGNSATALPTALMGCFMELQNTHGRERIQDNKFSKGLTSTVGNFAPAAPDSKSEQFVNLPYSRH